MKKILCFLAFAMSLTTFAQEKLVEGVVTSKQTLSSDNEQMNGQLAMIGDISTTTYFKNNKTRSETSSPMSGTTIFIADNDTKQSLVLMDNAMVGKKYMLSDMTPSEEDLKNVTLEKTNETKTILGYKCTKYNATVIKNGATVKMEIYATDMLNAISKQTTAFGEDFKGFPLYIKMDVAQQGMNMTIISEVTDIKTDKVSDDKFDMTPPEGYAKSDNLTGM